MTPLPPSQIPPVDPNAVVIPDLDSAIIKIDPVDGAKDYRAFVLSDDVQVLTDGSNRETVKGATIYCAGNRQIAAPAIPVPEVMKQIEVMDVKEPTEFVVEAIDELCPFPGLWSNTDDSFTISSPDALQQNPDLLSPVPLSSEDTIRARYGSMIINGHGWAPTRGQPAPPSTPTVLKRWKVKVSPLTGAAAQARRTSTFFADFSKDDPFVWVPPGPKDPQNDDGTFHSPVGYSYSQAQNSQFIAYTTNTQLIKNNNFTVNRGQLHTNLPDASQDVMGTLLTIPKKIAHLSDDGKTYLHVTFQGSTNSTSRRYWWLSLCGGNTPGSTFASDGFLASPIVLGSGFWNPDAANPSVANWNCLIVFPHDGLGTNVPPDTGTSHPQSSVIVLIHRADKPKQQTARNVSPQQVSNAFQPSWYRQMKGGTVTNVGLLDDLIQQSPRSHFDFYVSRDRIVMYVNGEQRMCNNFGDSRLTMAETSVGFNDALYHSSAEHNEMLLDFADRTGQLYYMNNTIFADEHSWDNLGFEESVGTPASFDEGDCYTPPASN